MTQIQVLLSPVTWTIDQSLELTHAFYSLHSIFEVMFEMIEYNYQICH